MAQEKCSKHNIPLEYYWPLAEHICMECYTKDAVCLLCQNTFKFKPFYPGHDSKLDGYFCALCFGGFYSFDNSAKDFIREIIKRLNKKTKEKTMAVPLYPPLDWYLKIGKTFIYYCNTSRVILIRNSRPSWTAEERLYFDQYRYSFIEEEKEKFKDNLKNLLSWINPEDMQLTVDWIYMKFQQWNTIKPEEQYEKN